MKMKIHLLHADIRLMKKASQWHYDHLKGTAKQLFEIPFKKLHKAHNGILYLDDMEMTLIVQALNRYGKLYYSVGDREQANFYHNLAAVMNEKKSQYQNEYGPKIKKVASA